MSEFPRISPVGLSGVAVTFAGELTDAANRAAIAFRAAIDSEGWEDVTETASTLVSSYLAVDLSQTPYGDVESRLHKLLDTADWMAADLPPGRKLWTLPVCFGTDRAPQLEEAAKAARVSEKEALDSLGNARTRIITLGFAPGQPYMGLLPEQWNIPRQSGLTPKVPAGALVVAIRQFVLFAAANPTGWRHVGQTAFRPFDLHRETPILFSPGDEVRFATISEKELEELETADSLGGAEWEELS
jgi:inhibitor of KinA